MAWQDTHEKVTERLLGASYTEYHKYRDANWRMGPLHHLTIRHGPIGDLMESMKRRDPRIIAVGLLHDLTDLSPLSLVDFLRGKYRREG